MGANNCFKFFPALDPFVIQKFLHYCKHEVFHACKLIFCISSFFRTALARADTLLSMKHGLVRLDNVWGVGGGLRPVNALVRQMVLLLEEYLSSKDSKEAQRCLRDLEVPHFHHELVYEVS